MDLWRVCKEKINQVYNFIVQRDRNFIKTKEEAQNIINLIGEPMLTIIFNFYMMKNLKLMK